MESVTTINLFHLCIVLQVLNYKTVSPRDTSVGDEVQCRNSGRPSPCGSGPGNETSSDNVFNRTKLTSGKKTLPESTLQYLSGYIEGINTKVKGHTGVHEKGVIKFDMRKREDAYKKTTPEEFPYAVFLLIEQTSKDQSSCSGSLITDEWVITASHCLYDDKDPVNKVWIYAGGNSEQELHDILETNATIPATAQVSVAETFIYHPDYPKFSTSYDIGLVKASKKFNTTNTVGIIKLAAKPWRYVGYRDCVTTGFGVVRDAKESADDGARKTHRLELKKPCLCNFILKYTFHLQGDEADGRLLCAKPRQDFGICSGDSGGGVVCEEDGAFVLRGLNQLTTGFFDVTNCEIGLLYTILFPGWSQECGDKNLVSMFQDVYNHLPWINEHVKLFSDNEILEILQIVESAASMHSFIWAPIVNVYLLMLYLVN